MNLDEKMKARLEAWREKTKNPLPKQTSQATQHKGKNYGDVSSLEEWDAEVKLSQRSR
jgi:hypothetical protein